MIFRELGREIAHRHRRLFTRRCCLGHFPDLLVPVWFGESPDSHSSNRRFGPGLTIDSSRKFGVFSWSMAENWGFLACRAEEMNVERGFEAVSGKDCLSWRREDGDWRRVYGVAECSWGCDG